MSKRESGSKRTQICQGVWQVIYEGGPGAVSVRSVAKQAGVSAGLVQHYFPSKDRLIHASLEHLLEVAQRAHRDRAENATTEQELWDLLTHTIPGAAEARPGVAVFYSFVAAAVADPEIARLLGESKTHALEEIERLLLERWPALTSSAVFARRLLAMSDGATQAVLLGSMTPDEAYEDIREALTRLEELGYGESRPSP